MAAIELAENIGLSAAIRELGYPSFHTMKKWCVDAGVEVELDEVKQKAANWNTWYHDSELLIAQQEIIAVGMEKLRDKTLDANGLDKISNAFKKASEMIRTIQGKANSHVPAKEDTLEAEAAKAYEDYINAKKVDPST